MTSHGQTLRVISFFFLVGVLLMGMEVLGAPGSGASQRPRVIVLTDFFKDPDDKQSLIRFLVYANEFDIEGLIATSLAYGNGEVHPEWIADLIEAYGAVLEKLKRHERPGYPYPSADALKRVVKRGAPVRRKHVGRNRGFAVPYPPNARDSRSCDPVHEWIGPGKDSDASRHIIEVVDKEDARPVWITVWGGAMDLAQALWRVRHERSAAETARFVDKLRVYQVSWQDTGAVWIWEQFPRLFLIQTSEAMQGIYRQGDAAQRDQAWIDTHVKNNHGVLGSQYPRAGRISGIKEGDTPSFLYLLVRGLSDPEHPEWGGWGGRFQAYGHGTRFYVDAGDQFQEGDNAVAEKQWTVGRWQAQRNRDFAARMDWCVQDYAAANHPPVVHLNGHRGTDVVEMNIEPGQTVTLSAAGSSDPDGDQLDYHWWHYPEAGSYRDRVSISRATTPNAQFVAPQVESPSTIHIILEATDQGSPPLTSYRRLVAHVKPSVTGSTRGARGQGPSGRTANIIFTMADHTAHGDSGYYGQSLTVTPHVDPLAREGLHFVQAYAGGPVCKSSRSVLMTGLHGGHMPARDKVLHNHTYCGTLKYAKMPCF